MERHVADFIESLRRKAASRHTISNYESDLQHFAQFLVLRNAAWNPRTTSAARLPESSLYRPPSLEELRLTQARLPEDILQIPGSRRPSESKSGGADLVSRLPKKLPALLGEGEAAAMVEMPQGTTLKAFRDRAILEFSTQVGFG